jgi:hypothetical protein
METVGLACLAEGTCARRRAFVPCPHELDHIPHRMSVKLSALSMSALCIALVSWSQWASSSHQPLVAGKM